MSEPYANIRSILGNAIGKTIVDITQHDADEFAADGRCYIVLMFDTGDYLKFYVGDDGFHHSFEELE